MTTVDLDRLLAQHRTLRAKLPNAWNAFFARFGALRPVQLAAIAPVLSGQNVLITAPTAGGKTEAVAAPLCDLLVAQRWQGLSVLLITPTRALVNDLFQRLDRPCSDMGVRLCRKTSDHQVQDLAAAQFLVTTPESLESLLTFRKEALTNVRAIVLDEIHLLDGGSRGDQLRLVLQRLVRFLLSRDAQRPQMIAMSATVSDPRRLANVYLGPSAQLVSIAGQRDIDARIIQVGENDSTAMGRIVVGEMDRIGDVQKALVFVNSRKQVDGATSEFKSGTFQHALVIGHHGSLAKSERERTEASFREAKRAICIATMTLEVGIDIGDIDLVVCVDPPYANASFLQRIGRGCRRLQGRTRVLCVARDRANEIIFQSMIAQARDRLPVAPLLPFRRSVLVQQALAYLCQVDRHCRTIEQLTAVMSSAIPPAITEECIASVLDDMVLQGLVRRTGRLYEPASLGWTFIQSGRVYSNMEQQPKDLELVDADSGVVVVTVSGLTGGHVQVAGRHYQVLPGGSHRKRKIRESTTTAIPPRYRSRRIPYAWDVGATLARWLKLDERCLYLVRTGDDIAVLTWLGELHNRVIAKGLERLGIAARPEPFSLTIRGVRPDRSLFTLQRAIAALATANPLGSMSVEKLADLGSCFAELSPGMQASAREDWLDVPYLQAWVEGIHAINEVQGGSALWNDLSQFI